MNRNLSSWTVFQEIAVIQIVGFLFTVLTLLVIAHRIHRLRKSVEEMSRKMNSKKVM